MHCSFSIGFAEGASIQAIHRYVLAAAVEVAGAAADWQAAEVAADK